MWRDCQADIVASVVKDGNPDEVKRLIANGADFELRVPVTGTLDDDYTPPGLAVREGHAKVVRVLLNAGAEPRRTIGLMRGSPLHDAAYFGKADHIDLLTPSSARGESATELDAQGPYNGLTALHDAVWHGHVDTVASLVRAGARRDLRTHSGLTPLNIAVLYGYGQIVEILSRDSHQA